MPANPAIVVHEPEPGDGDAAEPPSPFRLDPAGLQCPYRHYDHLRAKGPAPWVEEIGAFVVTSYAHVTELLRHPEVASSRSPTGPGLAALTAAAVARGSESGTIPPAALTYVTDPHPRTVFTIDPPDHTRQRKLVSRILTPRSARRFEPLVRAEADMLAAVLAHAGRTDAVATFARPLPERVILPLLRMPHEMVVQLREWTSATTHVIGNTMATDDDVFAMMSARTAMTAHFGELLETVRADPGDDLVTALLEARHDSGETLTEGERIGLLINLLVAGNETAIKATSAAVLMLARDRDVFEAVRADRSLVPIFVEEVLRLEPPTQGMFRHLQTDVDLDGTTIPAGSHVYLGFAAANRDAVAFPDPDTLRLDRTDASRHVSFGQGPHTCLGAWLARMEIANAIDAICDHVATMALVPDATLAHGPSYLLHGLVRLDVDVTPVAG